MIEQFSSRERDAFHVLYLSDKIPEAVFHGQSVKTVAYLRVSTAQQDVHSQRLAILEYARQHDFHIDDFIEVTVAGQASEKRWRPPRNKLGFSLQLCVLRYSGRLLPRASSFRQTSWMSSDASSAWTGRNWPIARCGPRPRHKHLAELRRLYGFRSFSGGTDLRSRSTKLSTPQTGRHVGKGSEGLYYLIRWSTLCPTS